MKKRLFTLLFLTASLVSCGVNASESSEVSSSQVVSSSSVDETEEKIRGLYALYKANGGKLSYEEWLETIKGQDGADGKDGKDGKDGTNGYSLLTGTGNPSINVGNIGDSYLNTSTYDLFTKSNSGWLIVGNIKGEDGVSPSLPERFVTAISKEGRLLYIYYSNNDIEVIDLDDDTPSFTNLNVNVEGHTYTFNEYTPELPSIIYNASAQISADAGDVIRLFNGTTPIEFYPVPNTGTNINNISTSSSLPTTQGQIRCGGDLTVYVSYYDTKEYAIWVTGYNETNDVQVYFYLDYTVADPNNPYFEGEYLEHSTPTLSDMGVTNPTSSQAPNPGKTTFLGWSLSPTIFSSDQLFNFGVDELIDDGSDCIEFFGIWDD